MKDMYTEKSKSLMKETQDTNKWKDILCSWLEDNIVKTPTPPKAIYRFSLVPIKTPLAISAE